MTGIHITGQTLFTTIISNSKAAPNRLFPVPEVGHATNQPPRRPVGPTDRHDQQAGALAGEAAAFPSSAALHWTASEGAVRVDHVQWRAWRGSHQQYAPVPSRPWPERKASSVEQQRAD